TRKACDNGWPLLTVPTSASGAGQTSCAPARGAARAAARIAQHVQVPVRIDHPSVRGAAVIAGHGGRCKRVFRAGSPGEPPLLRYSWYSPYSARLAAVAWWHRPPPPPRTKCTCCTRNRRASVPGGAPRQVASLPARHFAMLAAVGAGGPMLRTENLTKDYGPVRALDGLTLEVRPGEVFGILGPNGSGKTTALRIALGFLR